MAVALSMRHPPMNCAGCRSFVSGQLIQKLNLSADGGLLPAAEGQTPRRRRLKGGPLCRDTA